MELIKEWGMIAGFAGLALGAFTLLFRDVIKTKILAKLNAKQSLVVLILFMTLVTAVSVFSILIYYNNTSNEKSQILTVLVHGEAGKDELVLPNRGIVKLIYGDAIITEKINEKGEATFKQIPAHFFEEKAFVEILFSDPEGEPYRAKYIDSSYHLTPSQYIPLEVKLYGIASIKGVIKNFETGELIDSVRVSILGADTYSNAHGEYELTIPENLQQKFQVIRAIKKGYELFEIKDVPVQTKSEFPILLKPIEK